MHIGLDFDGTYTADPDLWDAFIRLARDRGHIVDIVTMRAEHESEEVFHNCSGKVDRIIFTNRKGKQHHTNLIDRHIDIWIDDMPQFVFQDAWTGD